MVVYHLGLSARAQRSTRSSAELTTLHHGLPGDGVFFWASAKLPQQGISLIMYAIYSTYTGSSITRPPPPVSARRRNFVTALWIENRTRSKIGLRQCTRHDVVPFRNHTKLALMTRRRSRDRATRGTQVQTWVQIIYNNTRVAGSNHRRRAFLRGDGILCELSGSKIELDRNSGSVSPRRRLCRVD